MKLLERFLWLALLAACGVVLLSAAGVADRVTPLESSTALFWWRWLLVVAVGTSLVLSAITWVLEAATKRPVGAAILWMSGLAFLWIALALNPAPSLRLLSLGGAPPGGTWASVAFCLGLLAIVVTVFYGARRGWVFRTLAMMACAVFVLWVWPRQVEQPAAATLPSIEPTGQRMLLIGLDGASWRYLDPLMERGALPNIQRLVEKGVRGPLKTLRPALSPALWTTMVTGQRPRDHGIIGHEVTRAKGDYRSLPGMGGMARGFGLKHLQAILKRNGKIVRSPATRVERRVPAFWNIATGFETPLDVVNWWATWPAEAILGRMVTDRTYFWRWAARGFGEVEDAVTFPEPLYQELAPMVMRPDEVTLGMAQAFMEVDAQQFAAMQEAAYRHHEILSEFKYYYSMFLSHHRITLYLLEKARAGGQTPSDLMVIFRLVDVTSHSSLQFSELVSDHLDNSPEELERFGKVVTESYRTLDRVVGELLEAFGEGNVILVSDHGFGLENRKKTRRVYDHRRGPDGIFLAAGPAFGTGEVAGLSLFHVLPILLFLKGFPVAADMVEDVPTGVFDSEFLARHPMLTMDTYGALVRERSIGESAVDEEMMQRLEALGYLD